MIEWKVVCMIENCRNNAWLIVFLSGKHDVLVGCGL
jgi:hypothetical protein